MDGGNLGRAKFLKTVTKEQPMRRVCAVVEEGGGGIAWHVMDMIRTTAISEKGLVALAFLTSSLHVFC